MEKKAREWAEEVVTFTEMIKRKAFHFDDSGSSSNSAVPSPPVMDSHPLSGLALLMIWQRKQLSGRKIACF